MSDGMESAGSPEATEATGAAETSEATETSETTETPAVAPSQPPVVVTTGNAAPVEIAAVTAVISGLLAEEGEARREAEPTGTSAWQRSQRSLRGLLEPGPGRWNG